MAPRPRPPPLLVWPRPTPPTPAFSSSPESRAFLPRFPLLFTILAIRRVRVQCSESSDDTKYIFGSTTSSMLKPSQQKNTPLDWFVFILDPSTTIIPLLESIFDCFNKRANRIGFLNKIALHRGSALLVRHAVELRTQKLGTCTKQRDCFPVAPKYV